MSRDSDTVSDLFLSFSPSFSASRPCRGLRSATGSPTRVAVYASLLLCLINTRELRRYRNGILIIAKFSFLRAHKPSVWQLSYNVSAYNLRDVHYCSSRRYVRGLFPDTTVRFFKCLNIFLLLHLQFKRNTPFSYCICRNVRSRDIVSLTALRR